jgi:hypothetical protein
VTDLYLPPVSAEPQPRRPLAVVALSLVVAATMIAGVAGVVALTSQGSNTPQEAVNGLLMCSACSITSTRRSETPSAAR